MLMAKLHAVFRSLVPLGLSVEQLIERASRPFGVSTFRQGTAPLDDTTIMGILGGSNQIYRVLPPAAARLASLPGPASGPKCFT